MNVLNKKQQEKQKIFTIFLKKLDLAYSAFLIWRELQNPKYDKIFSKNKYFWLTAMASLFATSSVELAKLVERKNPKYDEAISIFYLLEIELYDYEETLKKIKKLRNKVLMHTSSKAFLNLDKFMKELNLKYGEIEELFNKLIEIS